MDFTCDDLFDRFGVDNVAQCPNCASYDYDWLDDDPVGVRTDARWLWTNAPADYDYDLLTVEVGQGVHDGHLVRLVICESERGAVMQGDRYASGLYFVRRFEEGLA